jgi:hypothetical protein
MRTTGRSITLLTLSTMLLVTAAAVADDTMTVKIYNDSADDIVVTVYDMNAQPPGAILASQRINGFAWIPISVTPGAVGNGHVQWTARTADVSSRRCGHQDKRGLANDDSVRVFADSACVKNAR